MQSVDTSIAVILVAAGRGTRAGGGLPKQWRDLAGQPVIAHSLAAFVAAGASPIVIVLHPDDMDRAPPFVSAGHIVVAGGANRDDSVRAGLAALVPHTPDRVLIHDAARPCVTPALIARVAGALRSHPGAAPAVAVTDALWRGANGLVAGTQARDGLYRAQTPQGFWFAAILDAHSTHTGGAADDVEVARAAGLNVAIVEGDDDNLKLTWPGDFARATRILQQTQKGRSMDIRTGNGFDVHAFCEGDHVWLCGVRVPHTRALLGHSDADVGLMALTDALYGALAEGDIGVHFPPSDPQWKGADSRIFLAHAMGRVAARGFRLTHCDVTLICEKPKIGP
ncbi:MAG: 2-C-methyl-D-erythritol 4-phosphate cytidylyltransferase, partial [Gemmobacter sp.]|nr:2-C-methyl-D-erythritol 4-phosphate cytidylyltransferase [Gemmobacter sp.]